VAFEISQTNSGGEVAKMYDDVFRDMDKALVRKQEIKCFKQEVNGRIRWIVEIDDPQETKKFESKMFSFFERMKRMGKKYVSNVSTEEEI
jgi:hypothetical protein